MFIFLLKHLHPKLSLYITITVAFCSIGDDVVSGDIEGRNGTFNLQIYLKLE